MAGEGNGTSVPLVSLLGPVDIFVGGSPAGISQPGLRILLAMLALSANKVVPVGALIDALWQEDASRQREKNLHVQVHLLRRRLAGLEPGRSASRIVTAPPGYLLSLDDGELDAQVFATLAREARLLLQGGNVVAAAEQFGNALRLWRGPALGEVADACPRLAADAAGLEEQRLAVVEDKADAELAAGYHAELACHLPGLIAQYPLRERLRGQLMLALYRCGRQADALAAYHQARQVLSEELGLDPGPQLKTLQQQILAADPRLDRAAIPADAGSGPASARPPEPAADDWPDAARPPAEQDAAAGDASLAPTRTIMPRQLPVGVRHFAGRDSELMELDGMLDEASATAATTVIVITGTAGVGKTALALHWAHGAAPRFPDGQLYINLRGYHPSGIPLASDEAIRVLLNGLGVLRAQTPDTPEAQAGLYRSLLAGRRVLIVLDNARDPEQVRPLLPGGSDSFVLVTSRSSLSGLIADVGAYPVPLGLLSEPDAQALLAARLGAGRTVAEPAAVRQIIQLCARLPLALAITAARAAAQPALPIAALADELADERDRLDALDTGEQATSARAVFSWSYRQLTEPAARMFRLIGSHPGPDISLAAAASMSGVPRPQARRMLTELAGASLLTEHCAARYVLHDLLHAYAAELAPDPESADERGSARESLIDHYLHTAHAGALLLAPLGHPIVLDPPRPGVTAEQLGSHELALAWFRTELQVLLASVRLAAAAGLDKQAWQLPWTLRSFLDGQGLWQDWDAMNQIALAAAQRLQDHNGLGWTHHRMAQVCSLSGAIDDGIAHNMLALSHFEQSGNVGGQGSAQLGLCISLGRQGNHEAALLHGQQALALFRAAADRIGEAYMLHLVGLELARLGSAEQGRDHCTRAVELYGELGDSGGLADAWHSLGTVHQQLGENVEAIACFQQALMLSAELGDLWGQAYCLIHVGDTHDAAGDLPAARETWQQALEVLGDLQHPEADRVRARLHETAEIVDGDAALSTAVLPG